MTDYVYNPVQAVPLNQGAIFNNANPCPYGFVYHEDGSGILILRGVTRRPCERFARYRISVDGNIALPTGGTVGPIAMALAVNGETKPTSRAIVTPAAVEEYFNIASTAVIDIPRGCCFSVSFRNVSASDDPTVVAAPLIYLQNLNISVGRE